MLSQFERAFSPKKKYLLSGVKHMLKYLNNLILIILLITAASFDVKKNKIPNFITFPLIIVGLILNIIMNGFGGLTFSLTGFAFGLAIFFIPFALGLMGAGDVKLMAAIGALMGFKFTVLSTLYTAAAGLIVVFGYLIYKNKIFSYFRKYFVAIIRTILINIKFKDNSTLGNKLKRYAYYSAAPNETNEKLYVPYGLAIALGTLFVLWGNYKGYIFF